MRFFLRSIFLLVLMTFALSRFLVTSPALAASITCDGVVRAAVTVIAGENLDYRLAGSGPGIPSPSINTGGSGTFDLAWILNGPGSWNVDVQFGLPGSGPADTWYVSASSGSLAFTCYKAGERAPGPPAVNLLDGRINNDQSKDVAAPVAVYCADGNINIYKIDAETGEGTGIIKVAQVEGTPESTELLASAQGVNLYWLGTGEYQINTLNFEGYPYWITWVGCSSDALTYLAP